MSRLTRCTDMSDPELQTQRPLLLYDGQCNLCTTQAKRLQTIARGRLTLRSLHDKGILSGCPGLTVEACMKEVKLVERDGSVYGGAEAVVRAVRIGWPILGWLLNAYYVPGIRRVADRAYAWVARNRYRRQGPDEPSSPHHTS